MENIKFNFIPSQAKSIYQYKSLRTKVLKCNANITFNKQCLSNNLIPKYANIKIPHTSKAASFTQIKIHTTRIKDEIRFLYMKKTQLNKSLYIAHLKVAQEWGDTWPLIRDYIHNSNNTDMANIIVVLTAVYIFNLSKHNGMENIKFNLPLTFLDSRWKAKDSGPNGSLTLICS